MTDCEARDDESTAGVELIRPTPSWASRTSVQSLPESTSSQKCDDARYLARATMQATLAAKTILASGGSEDTALKTAKAAALATLLESHIGIAAFSNSKGGASAFRKRRQLKQQSEVVASMALMSATNQVCNETDSDISLVTEDPFIRKMSVHVPRPPGKHKKTLLSPITIIKDKSFGSNHSVKSKVSNFSRDSAKTETESKSMIIPFSKSLNGVTKSKSKTTKTETKSKSIMENSTEFKSKTTELHQNMGSEEKAESQILGKGVESQESGKQSTATLQQSEKSSTGATRPHITGKPPVTPRSNVTMNVLQSSRSKKDDDETLDEAVYFVNHGSTNAKTEKYEWLSTHSFSDASDADDNTLVTNESFMEKHVDPCLFFWRCGGQSDVEDTKVEAKVENNKKSQYPTRKRLPTSKIEKPRIVLSSSSFDSETDDEDRMTSSERLTDRQKKFRSKLRAAARKKEFTQSPILVGRDDDKDKREGPERDGRDDDKDKREGPERDGNNSTQCSALDAEDYTLSSQSSSFHKDNARDKKSWKRLLKKMAQNPKSEGREDEKDKKEYPPKIVGNSSSQCSLLDDEGYADLSSRSSSFQKGDSKGKKSWKKMLGVRNPNSRR